MGVQVDDRLVAGAPDDFAVARHLRVSGSNAEIGQVLAGVARDRHGADVGSLDPTLVRARRRWYERNYPIHYQRMAGVAQAFGVDRDDDRWDCAALGLPLGGGGCSVAYIPGDQTKEGSAFLSRNYDFTTATLSELLNHGPVPDEPPMSARPYVVEAYPDQGYPSLYLTYSYALVGGCFDGINSEGLMVSLMAIYDGPGSRAAPVYTRAAGLAEMETPRLVLDTCATVDEAAEALLATKQYIVAMPCHYIVGDANGQSLVFERSECGNAEYLIPGCGQIQVATNHLQGSGPNGGSTGPTDPTRSRWRRDVLESWLTERSPTLTISDLKRANARVACNQLGFPSTEVPGSRPSRTMYHALYRSDARSLEISFYLGDDPRGGERRSGYLTFALS